jgi:hypothetical protein
MSGPGLSTGSTRSRRFVTGVRPGLRNPGHALVPRVGIVSPRLRSALVILERR